MDVMKDFLNRLAHKAVPVVYMAVSRLLFATCRITEHGRERFDACNSSGPYIGAGWHYGVLYTIHLIYQTRHRVGRPWVMMLSASRDAEYIAGVLQRMDLAMVRGSKGKGGLAALREMTTLIKSGYNAGIIADGSQGPARVLQAGTILLASKTGVPILPVAWSADRYISFRSWDRTVLPKPFARLSLWYGEPLSVPEKLDSQALEQYRLELENRLNGIYANAWAQFGRELHFQPE